MFVLRRRAQRRILRLLCGSWTDTIASEGRERTFISGHDVLNWSFLRFDGIILSNSWNAGGRVSGYEFEKVEYEI